MPLVHCRACDHQVDTSALACPRCGATDPGKKISRQQRDTRNFLIQLVIWLIILIYGGLFVSKTVIPYAQSFISKSRPAALQNEND